jgi:hypothetical protein
MCCFSRPVQRVADTQIFVRSSKEGGQFVVYSMEVGAKEDLAMILPLPVPRSTKEDAVKFINLEKYPEFFNDVRGGFPVPNARPGGFAMGGFGGMAGAAPAPPLQVVDVGSFEASFVPTVKDFERLDERFRLPSSTWERLPQYRSFGFAVFKLKKGDKRIHPMAFEFPRAEPQKIFLPTVHIHDGKIYPQAKFDHTLYCQPDPGRRLFHSRESFRPAGMFMKADKSEGIVDPKAHVYQKELRGVYKNIDVTV